MKNNNKWGYIFVPIANVIIILGKLGIFAYLAYHFNNIWIMLLALVFSGGTMTLNYEREEGDDKDE